MVCSGKVARDAVAKAAFGRPLDHKSISCQLNWNALLVARSSKEELPHWRDRQLQGVLEEEGEAA